jgi:glutamate---cysteine ligase / carboxylate-amine ligase
LAANVPALDDAFGSGTDFSVGIEEELLLVDANNGELSHDSDAVLTAMALERERARHDLYAAQVELSSAPSASAAEAVLSLERLRDALRAAGGRAIGAGLHPSGRFGDVRIVEQERYLREANKLRGIVRRTPDCALHVHVGMPDRETAIRVCNGLRDRLPVLEALAANSPFWHGVDSGLASARRALRRGYPRVDPPPPFDDFEHYRSTLEAALAAAELDDYTLVWWEVRPHPRLGTVEVRTMDSQSSLAAAAGLAALVQGLAKHFAEAERPSPLRYELVAEASFRASRDGVSATLYDGSSMRPLAEMARESVEQARPHARELGSDDALEEVERILREGNGADRQREAHRRGGLAAVLEHLVEETARPFRASAIGHDSEA